MAGPLGKKVNAPSSFAPEILFSISRDQQRLKKQLINQDGTDIWNIHELFWVDKKGHAYHDEISIHIPASSPKTVESKSLKLFINSLIHQRFDNLNDVKNVIKYHLEVLLDAEISLDKIHEKVPTSHHQVITSSKLKLLCTTKGETKLRGFRGFRSLCPVTSQPDIAEIFIDGNIHDNDLVSVSSYLGSFFNRECFHELCIEYIYSDLIKAGFDIKKVEGYFERRGGIAIIPIRYSK
jgi:7-cyano-7-deazaguanine reductase